jgi:hypothetical protein
MVAFGRVLVLVVPFGRLGVRVFFGRIAQEKSILGDVILSVVAFGGGCIVAATFKKLII